MGNPLFMQNKDFNIIQDINTELIDEVLAQSVDIYKVEIEETDVNVYGESDRKYFREAFRINCLIQYNEPETQMNETATSDYNVTIDMFFQRESLVGTGFYPEIGDIVEWNDHYFEINHTAEPQLLMGNPEFNHQIIARAHRISLSNLQIEERPR